MLSKVAPMCRGDSAGVSMTVRRIQSQTRGKLGVCTEVKKRKKGGGGLFLEIVKPRGLNL